MCTNSTYSSSPPDPAPSPNAKPSQSATTPSTTPSTRKPWRKDHEINSLPSAAVTNTGFDRGHLTPVSGVPDSADTFLTRNAIAREPALNGGAWSRPENQIRRRGRATVLTGAIYNNCVIYKIACFPDGEILAVFAPNASRRTPGRAASTNSETADRPAEPVACREQSPAPRAAQ